MNIFKKLRGDDKLTPKERTLKTNDEIGAILKKYNCNIEVGHGINIIPLQDLPKNEEAQEKENYNKA